MNQVNSADNAQRAVLQTQNQFWAALKDKNSQAFEQILAEEFVSRSPKQSNQTRTEFINTLTSFPAKVLSVGSDNLEIHIFDGVAVVSGVQSAQVQLPDGQIIANTIAITNILQQQDGKWIMKLAHAVELV